MTSLHSLEELSGQRSVPLAPMIGNLLSPFSSSRPPSRLRDPGLPPVLYVKRLGPNAVIPSRQTSGSAGYDLTSTKAIVNLKPGERVVIPTELAVRIPDGYYGRIAPRSGLAVKNGLQVGAGVIDSDYRGEVMVLLFNQGLETINLQTGVRIAQLIIEKVATPPVVEVNDLDYTARGSGGFGSTGAQ